MSVDDISDHSKQSFLAQPQNPLESSIPSELHLQIRADLFAIPGLSCLHVSGACLIRQSP